MKRMLTLLLLLLTTASTASAMGLSGLLSGAGELPDPTDWLGVKPIIYEKEMDVDGTIYIAYTFPMPDDFDTFLKEYIARARDAGYTVSKSAVLEHDAWLINGNSRSAYLVPDYLGALLLLAQNGIDYVPFPTPTPSPTPRPTPTPDPNAPDVTPYAGGGGGGGHVEYVQVKQDCFACFGGTCDLCNGSGWYRNYGVAVPCSTRCTTCDGLGYWYTTQPVWVP